MSTNDKKIVIQEDEIIHKNYNIKTKGDKNAGINITISDKRVYVTDTADDNESISVASLEAVDFVKLEKTSIKRRVHFLVYLGLILFFGGIIMANIPNENDKVNALFLACGTIFGAIFFTIGACLSGSISLSQLVIGTNSEPIRINCKYISTKFVVDVQRQIFIAKDKYVKQANIQ